MFQEQCSPNHDDWGSVEALLLLSKSTPPHVPNNSRMMIEKRLKDDDEEEDNTGLIYLSTSVKYQRRVFDDTMPTPMRMFESLVGIKKRINKYKVDNLDELFEISRITRIIKQITKDTFKVEWDITIIPYVDFRNERYKFHIERIEKLSLDLIDGHETLFVCIKWSPTVVHRDDIRGFIMHQFTSQKPKAQKQLMF